MGLGYDKSSTPPSNVLIQILNSMTLTYPHVLIPSTENRCSTEKTISGMVKIFFVRKVYACAFQKKSFRKIQWVSVSDGSTKLELSKLKFQNFFEIHIFWKKIFFWKIKILKKKNVVFLKNLKKNILPITLHSDCLL